MKDVLPVYLDSSADVGISALSCSNSNTVTIESSRSIVNNNIHHVKDEVNLIEETIKAGEDSSNCIWLSILTDDVEREVDKLKTAVSSVYSPPSVDMNGVITGNGEDGLGSVAVTGCSLTEGMWYFEVEVLTDGLIQVHNIMKFSCI